MGIVVGLIYSVPGGFCPCQVGLGSESHPSCW